MQQMDVGIYLLRKRYAEHRNWFRSDRLAFIDSLFQAVWKRDYLDWKRLERVPGGAYGLFTGEYPQYLRDDRQWGLHVDDIYSALHVKADHWVGMWISIPNRHIVLWDCAAKHAKAGDIKTAITPIIEILPHLLNTLCPPEDKEKYPRTPFTYERRTNVPQNKQSGDCGVYSLKYIECHALGLPFDAKKLCDANIPQIRQKLASDIFHETTFRGTETRDFMDSDLYEEK